MLISFMIILIKQLFFKEKIPHYKRGLSFVISIYLISQSVSIITALDVGAFIAVYKNIILGIVAFYIVLSLQWNEGYIKRFLIVFVISTVVNVFYQFIVYFQIPYLYTTLSSIIYDKYFKFVEVQAQRPRFFIELCNEVTPPLIIYYFKRYTSGRCLSSILLFLFLGSSLYFSLISNFRIILLVFLFCSLLSFWLLLQKNTRKFISIVISLLLFLLILQNISTVFQNTSSLNRLTFGENEDIDTITGRFKMWTQALDMGLSSPLVGVGLGNYYDYVAKPHSTSTSYQSLMKVTLIHPHNIFVSAFSSTGVIGFFSTLLLFGYFLKEDAYTFFKEKIGLKHYLIVSFWGLFISAQTGPRETVQFLVFFWILRGMITIHQRR